MLSLSYSLPSVKGHGEQERCLRSGGEPVSFLSSKRARRDGGLGKLRTSPGKVIEPPSFWRPSLSMWKKSRFLGVVFNASRAGR